MGVSTDGLLVFGVDLGEEYEDFFETFNGEVDDDPVEKFNRFIEKEYRICYEENDSYKEKEEKRKGYPCLFRHCSGDYPMFIVGISGYNFIAYRGESFEISSDKLSVNDEHFNRLSDFLGSNGITKAPSWLLCSYWG